MIENRAKNRFAKVLVRDANKAFNMFGISMLIILAVTLAPWVVTIVFNPFEIAVSEVKPIARLSMISYMVLLVLMLVPSKVYGEVNLRGKGNYYALLPARQGEKFWSMVLYCYVIVPVVFMLAAVLVDTLFTLLPFGPYREWLWTDSALVEMAEYGMTWSWARLLLAVVLSNICFSSIFLFTNTIFKKSKWIKTLLWMCLIGFALMIVGVPLMLANMDWLVDISAKIAEKSDEWFVFMVYWGTLAVNMLMIVLFTWLTWRRLKRMEY